MNQMNLHEKAWGEWLLETDDDLLRKALEIDTAEKLRQEVIRDKMKRSKYRTSVFLRASALAACFVVVAGAVIAASYLARYFTGTPDTSVNVPINSELPSRVVFDSLDKVNYYAGLKVIREDEKQASGYTAQSPFIVNLNGSGISSSTKQSLSANVSAETESDFSDRPYNGAIWSEDISNERLTITKAIYFCLDVTDANEFLASKVGTGTVSAVITDLHIGNTPFSMITFKNGESYFSCLSEMADLQNGKNVFWAHLYIDGFQLFKNTESGISSFQVTFDESQRTITAVSWSPYSQISSDAPVDSITILSESTRVSDKAYAFSLSELEEYYNEKGREN